MQPDTILPNDLRRLMLGAMYEVRLSAAPVHMAHLRVRSVSHAARVDPPRIFMPAYYEPGRIWLSPCGHPTSSEMALRGI